MESGIGGHYVTGFHESTPFGDERKEAMFFENWLARNPGTRAKEIKYTQFKPSYLRSKDLENMNGVGYMRTMKIFFAKELVSQFLQSSYEFKEANGKKTYVDFRWEDEDFLIDVSQITVQRIRGSFGVDYFPNFYVNKEFAWR